MRVMCYVTSSTLQHYRHENVKQQQLILCINDVATQKSVVKCNMELSYYPHNVCYRYIINVLSYMFAIAH